MESHLNTDDCTIFCDKHLDEEQKYYCSSCRTKVCSDCVLERHSLHVHDVKKAIISSKMKGVRFNETHEQPKEGGRVKTDTELVKLLNEVEVCRRKTNDMAEAVTTAVNNRAEEVLRHIKTTRNQLLEECNTITKQNNAHLNALEKRIHLKLDKSPENQISKIFHQLIMNNGEDKGVLLHHKVSANTNDIPNPLIDIPVFEPGNIDRNLLKSMFGTITLKEEKSHQGTQPEPNYESIEKENVHPSEIESVLSGGYSMESNEHIRKRQQPDYQRHISSHLTRADSERRLIEQLKERHKEFASVKSNTDEMQAKRNPLDHHTDLYAACQKANKHGDRPGNPSFLDPISEANEKTNRNGFLTQFHIEGKNEQLQPVLHFSVECENKPVCCLCVIGSDSCWIHQGFSTTNSLLLTTANRRKTIEFNFVVEDWTLKPPDTLIAVDYNHRIVKLTPMGPADNPLIATQNIGWSFHHVDLHPIAVAMCQNSDIIVSLVDNWSYNIDRNSRRQVVRMNDHIELLQIFEFHGSKRMFTTPRRLTENTNKDICVLDETDENRGQIVVFAPTGSVKFIYTGHGEDRNCFNPNGVCCDNDSRIIISDYSRERLHVLDQNGVFLQYVTHPEIKSPFCLAVDLDDRFWIGLKSGKIVVISLQQRNVRLHNNAAYKAY